MKTQLLTLLTAALVAGHAVAFEPLLERRAKLESDQARAAFDARMDERFGQGVMARILVSGDSEDAEMVRLYLEDKLTPEGAAVVQWKNLPKDQRASVIGHIAAKPKITGADTRAVWEFTRDGEKWPQLEPRHAEILALYPDTGLNHYFLKYTKLPGLKGNTSFLRKMTPRELMKVTAGILPAKEYDMVRQEVLARCVGAMTKSRREAGLPNDVESFAAAMDPVLTALNAPLWAGLQEAAAGLGLDFTAPDHAGLLKELGRRCDDLDARRIQSAVGFAGSMMFWKGVEGYETWAREYKED